MADLIDVASKEIGTSEKNGGQKKYISWYGGFGAGISWCAIFVSWCCYMAGVSTSVVPKYASCSTGKAWFVKHHRFKAKGSYIPKRNDIVFFLNNRSHTGIVEYVSGNTLHTIEGNTSDRVARRSYSLSDSHITGYGVPDYPSSFSSSGTSSSSSGSTSSSNTEVDASEELKYLRKILKNAKKNGKVKTVKLSAEEYTPSNKLSFSITIINGKNKFQVPVKDEAKVTFERKGTPGKLTFTTIEDSKCKFTEGNAVIVTVNKKKFFFGYVFTKKKSKDGLYDVTVYDQLRYLKNKDTLIYKKKTIDQLVKIIAKRNNLGVGKLDTSKYAMTSIEENTEYITMLQNAIDDTTMATDKLFVLFDKVGELQLKNIKNLKLKTIIDAESGEDFTYTSSIDSNTYNQIKLVYENKKTGSLDAYITKSSKSINNWGLLQYFEKIDTPKVAKLKGQVLLKQYNQKTKKLTISKARGNVNARAGYMIPVLIKLGDFKVNNYMLIEKVTHTFSNSNYTMDLTLTGGGYSA